MAKRKKLKLGAVIEGVGWNYMSWRHPDMPADASENIEFYVKQAKIAEAAKFETLFLIDVSHVGPGNIPHYLSMFEGVSIMSALSMVTKNIGLSATIASSYADPYSAARQILSLDKISKGRASVNIITSNAGGMVNFSRGHLSESDSYPMQKEFMEIVLGLWDTYEDDTFIRDKARGIYFDPRKMHTINYRGKYFSVDGPLNISRSVQGRPVLYTAGTSSSMIENAARYTDAALILGESLEQAKAMTTELKKRVASKGRSPEDFIVAMTQTPLVGRTEKEAEEKFREMERLIPLYRIQKPVFFGSAEKVADQIQEWYEAGAMDMIMVRQEYPTGLKDFVDLVVPILQDRGIFRTEYESNTLRGNLELPIPEHRYVKV
ncbi:FMN-dependent oxidoreductase (nitrilotriacetate monooxygenase family) [Neobacillus niacini]|uniref:NtaA/DmoA family FMN-dependent monooxygenase n=1 Tax=Neobacillus niacini TaxID=86668 RepID=UPI00278101E9|nr:NtaA/DmoA family FMN-dependent monooxygenase [Neobacillus niacini]MDQ1005343.1 FMN-dependent oxidoreductase (nitrilotriacetate monooxygenase family) [Neobacillus niacini]